MRRAGFTLLEMMIVMGIFALLMALSAAAFLGVQRGNALVGLEALAADTLRQARATARSAGSPIVIILDAERGEIRGVSRAPIMTEDFESWNEERIKPGGRTGRGLRMTTSALTVPATRFLVDSLTGATARLVRPGRSDGLLLSCAIRPPSVRAGSDVIPLVAIAPTGDTTQESAVLGLALAPISSQRQAGSSAGASAVTIRTWQLVGWALTANGMIKIKINPEDLTADLHSGSAGRDLDKIIMGERWYEVAILHDGENLRLYLEGREVTAPVAAGDLMVDPALAYQAVIGGLTFGGRLGTTVLSHDATIDDVGLWRQGSDLPIRLPPGVKALRSVRIVVQPDGTAIANGPLRFQYGDGDGERMAEVVIAANGTITSSIIATKP